MKNIYITNLENQIIDAFQNAVLEGNIDLTSKYGHFVNHINDFVSEYVETHLTNYTEQITAMVELRLYDWSRMNHPTSTFQVAEEGILDALSESGRVYRRANYKITLADIT